MSRYKRASNDLSDLLELVLKGMVGIVVVYLVAKSLLEIIAGEAIAQLFSALISIALLFAVVVNQRVRKELLAFGKG